MRTGSRAQVCFVSEMSAHPRGDFKEATEGEVYVLSWLGLSTRNLDLTPA